VKTKTRNQLMLLLAALIVLAAAISAQAQTCTPPLWQGSVNATGSCNRLVVRWLNRDSISLIDHFTVRWLTDGLTHTLPANAIQDVRDDIYCQWASHVTITQFNKNGSVCFVNSTGAAPHTPSCDLCSGQQSPLGVVNSASGRGYSTADSLLTAYGQNLTTVTATASTKPFPTNLGGLQVWIDDQPCGLSFVSPLQANFYAPAGIRAGLRTVRATNAAGQSFFGDIFIQTQGPGVFTRDGTGTGAAAAQYYPNVASFFLTGINPALFSLGDVRLIAGGVSYPVQYVGQTGDNLIGLVQINVLNLPVSGQGAFFRVAGYESNGFVIQR